CTAANIFCARDGRVLTPPLSSGCLEGVTRSVLMEIAPQAGVTIEETALRPEDFLTAHEVVVTSTNRNLIGVGEIERQVFSAAPGPMTTRLEQLFAQYMVEYT